MKCGRCGGRLLLERDPFDVPEWRCLACGRPNVIPEFTDEDRSGAERKRANRRERRLGVKW